MTTHFLGLDPGFGGFKVVEASSDGHRSVHLPSVVGVGYTDTGLLSLGSLGARRNGQQPLAVAWNGTHYLAGHRVASFARPIERMDFIRLSDGPELRALTYTAVGSLLGPGEHTVALILGLPVEVMAERERATATFKCLREWLLGEHRFSLDGKASAIQVREVKAMAQPAGAFFAWGLDDTGHWVRPASDLKAPVGICDIGFNTLDLFAVEGGQVVARFTGGDTLGLRRAAELLGSQVRREHGVALSLHAADALLSDRRPQLHTPAGFADLQAATRQALDATTGEILGFVESRWGQGRQFAYLLFTGGGAEALRPELTRLYPHGLVLPDPVTANALGLARYAQRAFAHAVE